jgi:hypothetical protein
MKGRNASKLDHMKRRNASKFEALDEAKCSNYSGLKTASSRGAKAEGICWMMGCSGEVRDRKGF